MNFENDYLGPRPAALVESLRAFPYSTPSAVADLIDNSIVAHSTHIHIDTSWNDGNPIVEIVDNGDGMSESQLREALRFAGSGPSEIRDSGDLGRFGLGLKTASLSQCSRLTVTTIQNGTISNLGWDVDELRDSGRWEPCKSNLEIVDAHKKLLNNKNGTVIRWQKLDRLLGSDNENHSINDLDEIFEKVQDHLEMVFHRFLARVPSGSPKLTILINGQEIVPWDPFLDSYPISDQVWKVEENDLVLPSGVSRIVGYVLPTERQAIADGAHVMWEKAGRKRWNKLQGFYVYRLDRLLTIGGYLDLDRLLDEHSKLARICIELDNKTDNDWLLDVTKSSVTPPMRSRDLLNRVAKSVCTKATKRFRSQVFRFCVTCKQRPCVCPKARKFEFVWNCPDLHSDDDGKFLINGDHSTIRDFSEKLDGDERTEFQNILKLISKTIPLALLRSVPQEAAGRRGLSFRDDSESERLIRSIASTLVETRLVSGEELAAIKELMLSTEPFSKYPDIVDEVTTESGKQLR